MCQLRQPGDYLKDNRVRQSAPHVHMFKVETNKIAGGSVQDRDRTTLKKNCSRQGQNNTKRELMLDHKRDKVNRTKQTQKRFSSDKNNKVMTTENIVGIQTRAITEAQCMEHGAQIELDNNQEQVQGTNPTTATGVQNPAMNPTVNLHRTNDTVIEEFIRRHGAIGLDWYVLDFCNTGVGVLIKNRLPISTTRGKILFSCPPLKEFFPTPTFELDLTTGQVYTFLTPPEDIGVPCQQEEFDLELLAEKLQKDLDTSELCMEELERIPLVRKIVAPADIIDLEEFEYKIHQYCQLWKLYAEISVELKKKSELSRENAVKAC